MLGGVAMPEPEVCDEKEVELVARYKIYGDRDYQTFPWADGALVIVHECHQESCDDPVGHRHFVKFLDQEFNSRAFMEMRRLHPNSDYTDVCHRHVALEVSSLEFVGFLETSGDIVDRNGEKIEE